MRPSSNASEEAAHSSISSVLAPLPPLEAHEISGHLQKIYAALCSWGVTTAAGTRGLSTERRDELVRMYQPIIEHRPAAPLRIERRPVLGRANCRNPKWSHILDGRRLKQPRTLVDIVTGMGGGPELEFLELRLWEANASLPIADGTPAHPDVHVVAESQYGLRGDRKPLHFNNSKQRFAVLLASVEHVVLDDCAEYSAKVAKMRGLRPAKRGKGGQMWSAEGEQRQCVFDTLLARRPDLPDDAVVVFTDLDEIPSARTLQLLRSCHWRRDARPPFALASFPLPFSLRTGCKRRRKAKDMWLQGTVATMGYLRQKRRLYIRYSLRDHGVLPNAGVHLTSVGSRAHVDYKLLHHGEAGQILPLLTDPKQKVLTCEVDEVALRKLEALVRDDPVAVVRSWEHKSRPMKAAPSGNLEDCNVPWALLQNPERYPHFWGRSMGEAGGT